jgi:hypothetical protein
LFDHEPARVLGVKCVAFTDPDLPMPSGKESAPGKPGRPRMDKPARGRNGK